MNSTLWVMIRRRFCVCGFMYAVVLQHPVGSTGMASLMLPPRYVQPDAPSLSLHHPFTYIIETPISSSFAARCRFHLRHTQVWLPSLLLKIFLPVGDSFWFLHLFFIARNPKLYLRSHWISLDELHTAFPFASLSPFSLPRLSPFSLP